MLSRVSSPRREILRLGEDIFTLRREYFRLGEHGQCSLDYFRSSEIIFAQASGIFARAKFVSPKLKKKILFVSECLALLECNICI